MGSQDSSQAAGPGRADAIAVLFVADPRCEDFAWAGIAAGRIEVSRADSLEEAVARLASSTFDAVVLQAQLAAVPDADVRPLLDNLGPAALLLSTDELTSDVPALLVRLGKGVCLLPPGIPPSVQAQLVAFAAERSRLTVALGDRVAQLEARARELEQSRSRFRDVIERNADAIVVVDREGMIRFVNARAAEMFGAPRESLLDTTFGFPVVGGETTELDLLHPEGPRVIEMRVVESEWEGDVAYIASLRDFTERRRAEEGARNLIREQAARAVAEKSARRFHFLAEATTRLSQSLGYTATLSTLARLCIGEVADWAVVYSVNELGVVERLEVAHRDAALSDAVRELRERPIDESRGHPVLEVLRTRTPLLMAEIDEVGLAGISEDERHRELLRRLGIASFMLVPLVARDRELGAIGLVSTDPQRPFSEDDLTMASDLAQRAALALDNARLYEQAQKANRAKTDLLAVISHDLRTPLNSIIGHADLLSMGIPEPLGEETLERVERIRVGATHLVYLIDELLSFIRLEAGHEELRPQNVDGCAVARDVAAVMEPLAMERGLAFRLDVPAHPVSLRTDPDRLRQVLLNLVGNALKYTEQGEVLLLLHFPADDRVAFEVRDTGIGISPEHLERIFEPFWQVDAGDGAPRGGTGLGLAVVSRTAQLLGGTVAVESTVGRGSTFTVRLPARRGAETPRGALAGD